MQAKAIFRVRAGREELLVVEVEVPVEFADTFVERTDKVVEVLEEFYGLLVEQDLAANLRDDTKKTHGSLQPSDVIETIRRMCLPCGRR